MKNNFWITRITCKNKKFIGHSGIIFFKFTEQTDVHPPGATLLTMGVCCTRSRVIEKLIPLLSSVSKNGLPILGDPKCLPTLNI